MIFWPIRKPRWPPWHLLVEINFFAATAKQNSKKHPQSLWSLYFIFQTDHYQHNYVSLKKEVLMCRIVALWTSCFFSIADHYQHGFQFQSQVLRCTILALLASCYQNRKKSLHSFHTLLYNVNYSVAYQNHIKFMLPQDFFWKIHV